MTAKTTTTVSMEDFLRLMRGKSLRAAGDHDAYMAYLVKKRDADIEKQSAGSSYRRPLD